MSAFGQLQRSLPTRLKGDSGGLNDAYRMGNLDELRQRMDDVDLADRVEPWQRWLRDRVKPDTAEH
jgi:hypothetical protein